MINRIWESIFTSNKIDDLAAELTAEVMKERQLERTQRRQVMYQASPTVWRVEDEDDIDYEEAIAAAKEEKFQEAEYLEAAKRFAGAKG